MNVYQVEAENLSKASENRIHDDAVARRYGFSGGLVPGVEVYAYATHVMLAEWGRDWLAHGTATCRFLKPVYDGRLATVTGNRDGGRLAVTVESDGVLCATADAAAAHDAPAPALDAFPRRPLPQVDSRPPADETSLAPGQWLGTASLQTTPQMLHDYLRGVREADPIYASDGLIHPGMVLRFCNRPLMENVMLGPWIHMGSTVRNFAVAHAGDLLSARALVTGNREKKGHRFVDLDILVVANDTTQVARVAHTAIYRLRDS